MIRSSLPHVHVAALSHAGMSGKNNEDRYAISSFLLSKEDPRPAVFAVVADGIGGHQAGEIAAELAAHNVPGPGSFKERMFDHLFNLDRKTIETRTILTIFFSLYDLSNRDPIPMNRIE